MTTGHITVSRVTVKAQFSLPNCRDAMKISE
jgi:hypothetical protein